MDEEARLESGWRGALPLELQRLLEDHEKWIQIDGENSIHKRADLSFKNLSGYLMLKKDLKGILAAGTDFRYARLYKSNLDRAMLRGANLQGADLVAASFADANLRQASLRDADLTEAKLSKALFLDTDKLAGANLTRATLPEDIARFDGLKTVEEISKKAGKLFSFMMIGLLYCILMIITHWKPASSIKDITVPIVNLEFSLKAFFLSAPVALLGLHFYFLLYLQRLWEALAALPAIFPDGNPLDKKAYPWLPVGYVRAHIKLLREKNRPALSKFQTGLIQVLVFWLTPAVIGLFWWRYLAADDLVATQFHAVATLIAIFLAEGFIGQARETLRRLEPAPFLSLRGWARIKSFSAHHGFLLARIFIYAEYLVVISFLNLAS
jgi:hypothetical protein